MCIKYASHSETAFLKLSHDNQPTSSDIYEKILIIKPSRPMICKHSYQQSFEISPSWKLFIELQSNRNHAYIFISFYKI